MNRVNWLMIGWLAAVLTTAGAGEVQPIKAKVVLTDGQELNVELLGREGNGLVNLREVGKEHEVGLPAKDFKSIEFVVDLEEAKVYDLYNQGDFRTAAEKLKQMLEPMFGYLNLPHNLAEPLSLYLKCLYWDRQYKELAKVSYLMEVIRDPQIQKEAQLFRILGWQALHDMRNAERELGKVGEITRKDKEGGAMYFFALSQMYLTQKEWLKAQEAAATVVAFYPRDFEWIGPALCASAEAYGRAGHYKVAKQIIDEVNLAFPNSYWGQTAKELQQSLEQQQQKEAAEKAAQKAKAAAKAVTEQQPNDQSRKTDDN